MPLKRPRPSRATTEAFRKGLAQMIALDRAPANLPREAFPQRIYVLGLKAIAKGRGVERARPMVWEFLMGGGGTPGVLVCVGDPPGKKPPRMTSMTHDPIASDAIRATRAVEALPQVQKHRYELRRLRISALSIGAFWLKSLDKGRPDLAIPYHAIQAKLKRMQAYPMEEFLSVLRPIAEQRHEAEAKLRAKAKGGRSR